MPVPDSTANKASWAEEVETHGDGLLSMTISEPDEQGIRTIRKECLADADGQRQIITRRIKTEKIITRVNKPVAARKQWTKFGAALRDAPGPDLGTTSIGEEVPFILSSMQGSSKMDKGTDKDKLDAEDGEKKSTGPKMVVCRICKGDHWTLRCPYKDSLQTLSQISLKDSEALASTTVTSTTAPSAADASKSEKYVPPSKRNLTPGVTSLSSSATDVVSVRVTNLSEDVSERDVNDLFRRFGHISRVYLAKDKVTNLSKGFAFVTYESHKSAEDAIAAMHGYGYHNLILNVEWAKPSSD